MTRRRKKPGSWPSFFAALLLCAAPFGLLPLLLYRAPEALMRSGLFLLLWVCYPLLALFVPAWASRRGVPALVACVVPTAGYLLLLVRQMAPVLAVLLTGQALAVVSAAYGQERRRRAQESFRK